MTPEEIEFYKFATEKVCNAWMWGSFWIGMGISCISITSNIIGRGK